MVGYYGVGCGFGMEVRLGKSDRCGTVAIFGYVFWVHGYAAGWYGGLWRCVYGFPAWFVAARSVCSWVCVNFDFIFFFFVGHLLDSEFAIGLI